MSDSPQIGAVLLNWNGAPLTIACLDSILSSSGAPHHVVVVDNGSEDDSVARILAWARERGVTHAVIGSAEAQAGPMDTPWLLIIRAGGNGGFAVGNNHGIRYLMRYTSCSHVLLLNNDATVAPDFFEELRKALQLNPDAGLLTGSIYEDRGDRKKVWYAGGTENPYRALTAHLLAVPRDPRPIPTEFISGCAMLISRRVLQVVGLLAECYAPVYGEDAEYSLRVREAGIPLIYAPRAIVYHRVGATVGPASESPLVTYCQIRHRVFLVRRNYRGWKRIAALSYLVVTKPGRVVLEILKGNPRIGAAVLRGFVNGMISPAARTQ